MMQHGKETTDLGVSRRRYLDDRPQLPSTPRSTNEARPYSSFLGHCCALPGTLVAIFF